MSLFLQTISYLSNTAVFSCSHYITIKPTVVIFLPRAFGRPKFIVERAWEETSIPAINFIVILMSEAMWNECFTTLQERKKEEKTNVC